MEGNELFGRIVKAVAAGDGVRAVELDGHIAEEDRQASVIVVSAVFAGAVERRFKA